MKTNNLFVRFNAIVMFMVMVLAVSSVQAGEPDTAKSKDKEKISAESFKQEPVELDGDSVEFNNEEGKFIASGNVVLRQSGATLYCDRLEFYRDRKEAHAEGNIVLDSDRGTIWADKAFYNFQTKKGEFTNARIIANPIYGQAASISKIRDNYYVMADGYLTTSDYDDPEWRIKSRQIEVFPGEKAIARNSTMYVGGLPVVYMPKYVQDLRENRPHLRVIPGYKKDWGAFLLTTYRVYPMEGVETSYHLDYRERRDLAWGIDLGLTTEDYGRSLLKTYYMNERKLGAKHVWEDHTIPTEERERYKVEWRHKWDFSPATSLILQYYKLSDSLILKDYFEKEYRADQIPATYALLTHTTASSTAGLRVDKRVNEFETVVERLPEASYIWNNQQIGDTGVYFKSSNYAVNLVQRTSDATDEDNHTVRLMTDNELSRPFRVGFMEFRPFVGQEESFYTNTLSRDDDNSFRGVFKAGSDASTKFYRIYNVQYNKYGIKINQLRHVVTPTVAYQYHHAPTLPSGKLFQYDTVDARSTIDKFALGLENKLQTKVDGKSIDLFRSLLYSDYVMKDQNAPGSAFDDITLKNEFYINKYVRTSHDVTYDPRENDIKAMNADLYLTDTKKIDFDISRRFARDDDDLITAQLAYKINPKWRAVIYERCNVDQAQWQEQQYSLIRDLHSWDMELAFKSKDGYDNSGKEIWVIFTLKAFPSVAFDGKKGFFQSRPGAQSGL